METKKCRRLFKTYPDSFDGRAAISCLLTQVFPAIVPDKSVDETNAESFFALMIKKNLIQNVEDPKMIPEDFVENKDKFYRFLEENIAEEIKATAPMKRSSSLRGKRTSNLSRLSINRPPSNLNRRTSSSTSQLQSMIQASLMVEQKPHRFHDSPSFHHTETSSSTYDKIDETEMPPLPSAEKGEPEDFLRAWTHQLRSLVQNDDIVDNISEGVLGENIQWNSLEVGESGVVKVTKDDLASDIKRSLKALMNWPKDINLAETPSPVPVFEKLCLRFQGISPVVRNAEADKLIKVWLYFNKAATHNRYRNDFHSSDGSVFSSSTFSSVSSQPLQYIDGTESPMPRNTRAAFHQNLRAAATSDFDSSNASSCLEGDIALNPHFRTALKVVLLSLPSSVRRSLHLICRYIKRISINSQLNLNVKITMLDYLLQRIGPFLFDFNSHNFKDAAFLTKMMIEHQTTIFAPSKEIIQNAEKLFKSRVMGAASPKLTTYCRQIDPREYASQANETNRELLALLDSIEADENLSVSQKKKKLESFQKTYPHLYAMKYPNAFIQNSKPKRQPTPTRIVNQIRKLTRRTSAKRTT